MCKPRKGCASPGQGVQAQDGMCKPRAGCASPGWGSTHGPLRAAPLTAPLPCRLPATMSLPSKDHTVSTCPLCVCSQRALRGSLLPPPGPPAGLQGEACPGGRTCRPARSCPATSPASGTTGQSKPSNDIQSTSEHEWLYPYPYCSSGSESTSATSSSVPSNCDSPSYSKLHQRKQR